LLFATCTHGGEKVVIAKCDCEQASRYGVEEWRGKEEEGMKKLLLQIRTGSWEQFQSTESNKQTNNRRKQTADKDKGGRGEGTFDVIPCIMEKNLLIPIFGVDNRGLRGLKIQKKGITVGSLL
jgi:hypothetical protein